MVNPPSNWHRRCCNSGILITPPKERLLRFCRLTYDRNRPPESLRELQREWFRVRGSLSKQSGADDQDLVVEAELLDILLPLKAVLVLNLERWGLVSCVSSFVPATNILIHQLVQQHLPAHIEYQAYESILSKSTRLSISEDLPYHVLLCAPLASDGKKDFPDWFVLRVSKGRVRICQSELWFTKNLLLSNPCAKHF